MPFHDRSTLDRDQIELGGDFAPKFDEHGLIPCVAQHAETGQVLMVAFMNAQSLALTLETQQVHYWSRSRGKLWKKGESSGMVQHVRQMLVDCDQDCLIARVVVGAPAQHPQPPQAACHTGHRSCFYREVRPDGSLEAVEEARAFDPEAVYG